MISAALNTLETDEQRKDLSLFYEKNEKRLFSYAYSRLHNRYDAEDSIQKTFLNIMKYPKKFFELEEHKKTSYVLTVMGNVISHMLKDSYRESFDELDEYIEDGALSVEDIVVGENAAGELKEFIRKLPETRKSPIVLKAVHGLSYSQIADILEISEDAVRKRISNTYRQIRLFLEGEANDD